MEQYSRLIDYMDGLRKQGKYLLFNQEATQVLGISDNALRNSISRLSKKGKIAYIKKGLYQVIPIEHEDVGSLPPEWIIDELMAHLDVPYYVGLLSAASLHGAAHPAPQIFQVMCQKTIPALTLGHFKICFYVSKDMSSIPTQEVKTPAGSMKVSTPEGTAFDLMRYPHQAGHLNHVVTVLNELAESMDEQRLAAIAPKLSSYYSQRLGYLLDSLGHQALTEPLYKLISHTGLKYIPLKTDSPIQEAEKNKKWHVLVNEKIEPDL
jgi:predicted transcriptional regulator of viral defense system